MASFHPDGATTLSWEMGWYVVGPVAILAIAAIGIVTSNSHSAAADPSLRFATATSQAAISEAERMIADNSGGIGARIFATLLLVYTDAGDANTPTTDA
jgi:hypothetical protein